MSTNPLTPKCGIPREQLLVAFEVAPAITRTTLLYLREELPPETPDNVLCTLTVNALAEAVIHGISVGVGLSAAQHKAFRHDLMECLGRHSNGSGRVEIITNEAGN